MRLKNIHRHVCLPMRDPTALKPAPLPMGKAKRLPHFSLSLFTYHQNRLGLSAPMFGELSTNGQSNIITRVRRRISASEFTMVFHAQS